MIRSIAWPKILRAGEAFWCLALAAPRWTPLDDRRAVRDLEAPTTLPASTPQIPRSQVTRTLVLGSRNRKKVGELEDLLAPHGFVLKTLADFPDAIEVEETGDSFAANARLKATIQAKHLGQWVLGEDSGLAVDALGGAPGVLSARFAGEGASDEENNRLLLERLQGVPFEKRTAHYVCHVAVADPQGIVRAETEAICRGRIRSEAAGSGGFGYDPLFEIAEYHRTFGELAPAVKAVLSHRSRAIRQLVPQLLRLAESGAWPANSAR